MKVICAPQNKIPRNLADNIEYFSLYSNPGRPNVNFIANGWKKQLEKIDISPTILVWDFVTITLSIAAADLVCVRKESADGWTRKIELKVFLCDPSPWIAQKEVLEKAFRFLTGDVWVLEFVGGGIRPPKRKMFPLKTDADCISLLSGGMDSLIGGIDLVSDGYKPCFVSQEAKGDVEKQKMFSQSLMPYIQHFQWKNPISQSARKEGSTRGRSIVFLGYALLAATTLKKWENEVINIYIPENGFISLNIALNAGRLGSLSTKTTHPVFLNLIQAVWDNLEIKAKLIRPYQFKTKGEMLLECKNQALVDTLICNTTSCGKFLRYGNKHCGRCVPCMVRRAAFLKAKKKDTTEYVYPILNDRETIEKSGANDIGAVAAAYIKYKTKGINRLVGGALSFSSISERKYYVKVIERGLEELGEFLKEQKIL